MGYVIILIFSVFVIMAIGAVILKHYYQELKDLEMKTKLFREKSKQEHDEIQKAIDDTILVLQFERMRQFDACLAIFGVAISEKYSNLKDAFFDMVIPDLYFRMKDFDYEASSEEDLKKLLYEAYSVIGILSNSGDPARWCAAIRDLSDDVVSEDDPVLQEIVNDWITLKMMSTLAGEMTNES